MGKEALRMQGLIIAPEKDEEGARWLPERLVRFAGRVSRRELRNEEVVMDVADDGGR